MSEIPITEAELQASLDGELPVTRTAALEAHLTAHPEVAARLSAYREDNEMLRTRFDAVLDEPLPARLRQLASPRRRRTIAAVAAALLWLTLGGLAGWYLHGIDSTGLRADAPSWARRAAVAHIVYAPEVRHPVEVGADQEAHLVAWLSKRLGTPLKIPQLSAQGYNLVGGRLLPGDQGPVAQFMYQDAQGRRLTLYLRSSSEDARETAFRFAQDGPVRVFYWVDRKLGYALSGEIGKDELLRIATAVYQHLNP